ncbi:MAG TPA: tetratricopeptide repeat protein, partial [Anaeromyxobacter sp.]|nr:tetratricopeptide repeat protein [Anaeromyxobacter sp.]
AGASAAAAVPPASHATASELARRIVPVQTSYAKLMAHWAERRTAQREADPARADAAEKALLAAKRELAIVNLAPLAAAELRESRRALASNLPAEAVAHARVAVELAPDLPDAHLALARARLAAEPGKPGPALGAVADALWAARREPRTVRAFAGDLAGAAFAALFTGALATVLVLVLRSLRLFLHDFHHLPLVRGTAFVQASFLAVVLLALPIVLGLGPLAAAAVALAAVWLYLSLAERLVATGALLVLVAMPWMTGAVVGATAWTGTLAEQVHEIEQGAMSDEGAAELAARFAEGPAPGAILAALGRHHKRRGELDEALRWYRRAVAADARAPELQVNIGNVLFLQGDLEGAKAAYLAATDQAGSDVVVLGAAHYDLSKLYLRTSDMEKSAAAREKAEREAGDFLRRFGSDDDFSANRYLVDVPVPHEKLAALAAQDGAPDALAAWARARIAGALPRPLWPWGAVAAVAALWAAGLAAGGRLGLATPCERCGRAACRRCDGSAGELCAQCVNVFLKKGVVDARDRLRKEAQVRRHAQLVQHVTRALAVVAGGAGQLWHGAPVKGALLLVAMLFSAFVLWFWRGVTPPPQQSPYVLAGKIAVAAPLGLAVWALAIRDAFRRTE